MMGNNTGMIFWVIGEELSDEIGEPRRMCTKRALTFQQLQKLVISVLQGRL